MINSWRERLVAGLKSWRSSKSDVPDRPSEAGRRKQSDRNPEKSIKFGPADVGEKASQVGQQVGLASAIANEQNDGGSPEHVSVRPDKSSSRAEKRFASRSGLQLPQKQSRATTPQSPEILTPDKEPTAKEGGSLDETADGRIPTNNHIQATDQDRPKQVTGKALSKRSGGLNENAAVSAGLKNPSERWAALPETPAVQEPSSNRHTPLAKSVANKNVAVPVIPASPRKRSGLGMPEITDEQVTDELLAELEAENVRLKLLLRETLSAKQDNS
ncbi:hypothetical protein [Brucella intermedia]|uniref:hypothetical protein n=1 Tax=Brucella intermedia TaxID=94625 RepID=UPI00235E3293|nr:hypothetical protein [Brucella intermedia]